ncbi:hypothetical protein RB195_023617 [Necator americanus]|uniref:HMG box domain-containing protein n=1 Tax=Necator americanus TaxID=51031 RepID=A0ABR1EM60_NECAM
MTIRNTHTNSQFQKISSPDDIIVSKRLCLTDVANVSKLYTGSDRCLPQARFSFTLREVKTAKFRERFPNAIINRDLFAALAASWEDSAMDNIEEEYDRLVEHLHDCTGKAESSKTTKRRLCGNSRVDTSAWS